MNDLARGTPETVSIKNTRSSTTGTECPLAKKVRLSVDVAVEEGTCDPSTVKNGDAALPNPKGPSKLGRKRLYALVFGYKGTGYHGLQKQLDSEKREVVTTVEGELEKALYAAGGVSAENFGNLQKVGWSRAARTDKGVHAVAQVVSVKLVLPESPSVAKQDVTSSELKVVAVSEVQESQCEAPESSDSVGRSALHHLQENGAALTVVAKKETLQAECPSPCDTVNNVDDAQRKQEIAFLNRLQAALDTRNTRIQVFNMYRVTQSFDARLLCDKRAYRYLVPVKCLYPVEITSLGREHAGYDFFFRRNSSERLEIISRHAASQTACSSSNASTVPKTTESGDDDVPFKMAALAIWDSSVLKNEQGNSVFFQSQTLPDPEDIRNRIECLFRKFEGNQYFFNFTSRCKPGDANVWRFMESFKVTLEEIEGESVIAIRLVGQSFLLNQIRKMIGLIVEIIRGTAPEWAIEDCLTKTNKRAIHMAPAAGLFLERPYYCAYNEKRANPPATPHVDFSDIQSDLDRFRDAVIYPTIINDFKMSDYAIWTKWLDDITFRPYFSVNYPPVSISLPPKRRKDKSNTFFDRQPLEEILPSS